MGGALLLQGRARDAVRHLRQAAARDPRDERLPFNLGHALNAAAQPADAALEISPDHGPARQNLSILQKRR